MPSSWRLRLKRTWGELKTAALGALGVAGALTYSLDASVLAGVTALLLVSGVGWMRLIRRRPELELSQDSARDLSFRYAWAGLVQAVPPWVFAISAYYHAQIHFGLEEVLFISAAILTAIPPMGLAIWSREMRRLAAAEESAERIGDQDERPLLEADIA